MKKKIIPILVIISVFLFMIFIYEPITFFAASTSDYWFSLGILIKANIFNIFIFSIFLISISQLIILISNKTKNEKIYMIYLLIIFTLFLFLYIQGNYLSYDLPLLNGSPIKWNSYTSQMIVSLIAFIIILGVNIFLFIKYKDFYKKIIMYVSGFVFFMLFSSLLVTMLTNPQIYNHMSKKYLSFKNINNLSKDKNFVIFLSDMTDSRKFANLLKENNKEYLLKDFTYYPDTLSAYPFTKESIPFILSGLWYENEESYYDYYTKAMDESKFLDTLDKEGYDINLYEDALIWVGEKRDIVDNQEEAEYITDNVCLLIEEMKYIEFKYLPFPLKRISNIESLNYNECKYGKKGMYKNSFSVINEDVYKALGDIELQENKYFQFLHIFGGHYPWDRNANFEYVENGTYEDKLSEALTVLEKYITRIKESGQYDNTVIIIMADHGGRAFDSYGLQNPILYIKGINETHDEMIVSNKKVSYADLNDSIYYDLLDGKKSTELLSDIDDNRIRRYIWYSEKGTGYFEQTLDGHAWESDKLKNTGKTY